MPPKAAALTPLIAAGDPAAFGNFYDLWFDAAYGLSRACSRRDEAFCLDVVQDVMLKVVRKLPALASDAAVAAWMARAVHATVIDRLRSEQRRALRERRVADARPEALLLSPVVELLAAERSAWLAAQLEGLPAEDRALLQQRFAGAATFAAVGQAFSISEDAAHGRIRRLVLRLAKAAKEWFGD
ncbi:MAG TPA: sigma-70 family RNA polymerase sigma factor [Planctomycetota bacterium]|nr:sigma-70 family RNA polymerase sigma factor [Planctomycetota bacterium]